LFKGGCEEPERIRLEMTVGLVFCGAWGLGCLYCGCDEVSKSVNYCIQRLVFEVEE